MLEAVEPRVSGRVIEDAAARTGGARTGTSRTRSAAGIGAVSGAKVQTSCRDRLGAQG